MRRLSFIPLIFLLVFFCYPLAKIVQQSFLTNQISGGQGVFAAFADSSYTRIIAFSIGQAALSTALTLLVGLPAAHVFARLAFATKQLWLTLATLPFVMPTVVVAAAFNALLGTRGLLGTWLLGMGFPPPQLLGTFGIILLAHVFYNFSVVVRVVGGFWATLSPSIKEAAATLGATQRQTFWHITLPLSLPAIAAAAALVFLFTFTSFGVILLLGGATFATLETEIYRQTAQSLRLDIAASLAFIQLLVTLALGVVSSCLQARATATLEQQTATARTQPIRQTTGTQKLLLMSTLAFIVLVIVAPLGALVLRSFNVENNLFSFYTTLNENVRGSAFFVSPLVAIRNSVLFALLTALLALGMGLPLAYVLGTPPKSQRALSSLWTKLLDGLLLLPLGTSAVTLGLGMFIAFDGTLLGLDLRASPWLLPLAHTLIALPFVVRTLLPATRNIHQTLRETAANLGATPLQILRWVDVPLLTPSLVAAAIFAFATSLGEFGASLLIARPDFPTMPLVISSLLARPGTTNYGQAMAMSVLLMLVTGASVWLIERLGKRMAF